MPHLCRSLFFRSIDGHTAHGYDLNFLFCTRKKMLPDLLPVHYGFLFVVPDIKHPENRWFLLKKEYMVSVLQVVPELQYHPVKTEGLFASYYLYLPSRSLLLLIYINAVLLQLLMHHFVCNIQSYLRIPVLTICQNRFRFLAYII